MEFANVFYSKNVLHNNNHKKNLKKLNLKTYNTMLNKVKYYEAIFSKLKGKHKRHMENNK